MQPVGSANSGAMLADGSALRPGTEERPPLRSTGVASPLLACTPRGARGGMARKHRGRTRHVCRACGGTAPLGAPRLTHRPCSPSGRALAATGARGARQGRPASGGGGPSWWPRLQVSHAHQRRRPTIAQGPPGPRKPPPQAAPVVRQRSPSKPQRSHETQVARPNATRHPEALWVGQVRIRPKARTNAPGAGWVAARALRWPSAPEHKRRLDGADRSATNMLASVPPDVMGEASARLLVQGGLPQPAGAPGLTTLGLRHHSRVACTRVSPPHDD